MRPERSLIADRIAAQHCPELLGQSAPALAELTPALALLSARLSLSCASGLARLSGSEAPAIRPAAPRAVVAGELVDPARKLTSYALLGIGAEQHRVLVACSATPVFRLVDRAFGGRGAVPDPLPDAFPLSAELLILRLEQTIATALADALGGAHTVTALDRNTSLSAVAPFTPEETVFELSLLVEEPGCEAWTLSLALPQPTCAALFAGRERKPAPVVAAPDPLSEPYASVPLTLTAVLVDMAVPFSRLATLRPGDIIPVAVARSVPLKAGERTIATGTIGEYEDRVAVQITSAF